MLIYKCIISGDEMFSDSYPMTESESGIFYIVEGKMVTESNQIDESSLGANPSAEEQCESAESSATTGINIVIANRLVETGFDKKQYMVYIKEYMKKVMAKLQKSNPDRVEAFKKNAQVEVKKVLENFKNYQFFIGETMNPDGIVALLDYVDDTKPVMYFFKDGLEEEKC